MKEFKMQSDFEYCAELTYSALFRRPCLSITEIKHVYYIFWVLPFDFWKDIGP